MTEAILKFQEKYKDKSEIHHVIDFLKAEYSTKTSINFNYVQALEKANEWTKKLNEKNKQNKSHGLTKDIFLLEDGFKIVQLVDENSYKFEGKEMGHCAASYFDREVSIFSLRDKNNNPHCTIEFNQDEKHINQIKGKGNKEVVKKYHKYVANFLNNFEFHSIFSHDIKNISSIYFGNYIFLNDEMPLNLTINKNLNVELTNFKHTFDELRVKGDVELSGNSRCYKIAKTLIVDGDLVIEKFHRLLKVADNLIVKGSVEINDCEELKLLASTFKVEGDVVIADCNSFSQKDAKFEFYFDKVG